MKKFGLPTFDGLTDPTAHVTSFNIAMRKANFFNEEKDAGYCQLFVASLAGEVLSWFSSLSENSVNSFHELSTAFLKNYIMFTRQGATVPTCGTFMKLRAKPSRLHGEIQSCCLQSERPRQHRGGCNDEYAVRPL